MRDARRDPHTWVVSLLYIGTFSSFIGFGFAVDQVLQVPFRSDVPTPLDAAHLTFLGSLVGLARLVGEKFADRFGGARLSCANVVGMAGRSHVVPRTGPGAGAPARRRALDLRRPRWHTTCTRKRSAGRIPGAHMAR